MFEIYTDGACRKNDGTAPCSWAMVVYQDGEYKGKKSGVISPGTNNIGELNAVLMALDWCSRFGDASTIIYTDSSYVQNGCSTWVHSWARNGWKKSDGKPILNLELWKKVYELLGKVPPTLMVKKVKGHAGIPGNERADKECNIALDNYND